VVSLKTWLRKELGGMKNIVRLEQITTMRDSKTGYVFVGVPLTVKVGLLAL
jgi:hypothetical protein